MPDAPTPTSFDAVVIGAGAAGLFCAGVAGQLGVKVLLVDQAEKIAEKIRISGGGRCNFTNRDLDPRAPHKHFLGANAHFCRSALARYTPADFLALVQRHGIAHHEKHKGQLFGDQSSEDFIRMLLAECAAGGVTHWQPCPVKGIAASDGGYLVQTARGPVRARSVVIATGGLSIPKIGATDFGYRIAQQFGLRLVAPRPALVPLTFDGEAWAPFAQLAGLALPVRIETGEKKERVAFDEDLLLARRPADPDRPGAGRRPGAGARPGQGALAQAAGQRAGPVGARAAGRRLGAAGSGLAAAGQRSDGQGAAAAGAAPVALGAGADRQRGLPQGGSDGRRRGHARAVLPDHGVQAARPVLHRRGGGRDRLAGRLQLPVGLGQRLRLRAGPGGHERLSLHGSP
jgi:hypothetical protein